MTTHVNDGGTWRQLTGIYVNDAGTWREIQEVYVNDAGTWRSVFVNDVITIADYNVTGIFPSGTFSVNYMLGADGVIYQNDGSIASIGNWITPQTNIANYECFATVTSGTLTSGTEGAWQSLSTNRTWSITATLNSTKTTIFTLQIRRASDATVLDSASITLRILRE